MIRYGAELEGKHKGKMTAVLIGAATHSLECVQSAVQRGIVQHLWLETQPEERFNWEAVATLAQRFPVTLLVRDDADVPPSALDGLDISLVWEVQPGHQRAAVRCDYVRVRTGSGNFDHAESPVSWRTFDSSDYAKDVVL